MNLSDNIIYLFTESSKLSKWSDYQSCS